MKSNLKEIADRLEKGMRSGREQLLDAEVFEDKCMFSEQYDLLYNAPDDLRSLLEDVKEAKKLARDVERFERCQIGLKRLAKRANKFLKEPK